MLPARAPGDEEARIVGGPAPQDMSPAPARFIACAVAGAVFLTHLLFILAGGPAGLAEDEAYYWEFSRRPDVCYFSKGPLAPLLIRAGCAVFGDTVAGVRLPALVLRLALAWCTWRLALLLSGSYRAALLAVILTYAAPLLLAAGVVMTADPPFVFTWAAATLLLAEALFGGRRWAWPAAGAAVGAAFLAKFASPLWFVGAFALLALDPASRPLLKTRRPWLMLFAAAPFAVPVIWWNARNGWVSFRHVGEDVGAAGGRLSLFNVVDFWLGQAGAISPLIFLAVCAATAWAAGSLRTAPQHAARQPVGLHRRCGRRAILFLLCTGCPLPLLAFASAFRKHASASWPAPAYVSLLILAAWFIVDRMCERRPVGRRWRMLAAAAVAAGFLQGALAHCAHLLYPAVAAFNARFPSHAIDVRRIDPTLRMRGWDEVGRRVADALRDLPAGALLIAADYQTAAALAFHVPGQPHAFCAGAYLTPARREPFSQYDIWPDLRLDCDTVARNDLLGRDALYVGPMDDSLLAAFQSVERHDDIVVRRGGVLVRRLEVWRCRSLRGFAWPGWQGRYNK